MNSTDKLFLILDQFTLDKPQWGVRELAAVTSLKPTLVHCLHDWRSDPRYARDRGADLG